MLGHLAYIAATLALAAAVSARGLGEAGSLVLVLGAIGAWRYSWAAINLVRAATYLLRGYPRQRTQAERAYAERAVPAHVYFLVTTYKIEPWITTRVYRSVFVAAGRSRGGATIVASVVDGADLRVIRELFAR